MENQYTSRRKSLRNKNFSKISECVFSVKGIDKDKAMLKVQTSLKGNCRESSCCLGVTGPMGIKINPLTNYENCKCRIRLVECGDDCFCSTSANLCTNRGLQNKKRELEMTEKIKVTPLKGVDPYTRFRIKDSLPNELTNEEKEFFIKNILLKQLHSNCVSNRNTTLFSCFQNVVENCKQNPELKKFHKASSDLLDKASKNVESFQSYPKGYCVIVRKNRRLKPFELIGEYLGEIYPNWRWVEKEKNIKSIKKRLFKSEPNRCTLPEFYNMMLERNENDPSGYDLVVVDAINKSNFVSRLSHSCEPNSKVVVVASEGKYRIAVYSTREIGPEEEITFDYFCRTDSEKELKEAVCLCGSNVCRGSFLIYWDDYSDLLLTKYHPLYNVISILLKSGSNTTISNDGIEFLKTFNIGSCLLSDLPMWAINFIVEICKYIKFEEEKLPLEIEAKMIEKLNHSKATNPQESANESKSSTNLLQQAKDEAVFIRNKRVQSLAITIDRLKYFLRHKDQSQLPPLALCSIEFVVRRLWTDPDSLVKRLKSCAYPHLSSGKRVILGEAISELKVVQPSRDSLLKIKQKLFAIRDFLWSIGDTKAASNQAAADLLHLYASTQNFFTMNKYTQFKSEYTDICVSTQKTGRMISENYNYSSEFPFYLLINWFKESTTESEAQQSSLLRGWILLPDIESCYCSSPHESLTVHYYKEERSKIAYLLEQGLSSKQEAPSKTWPKQTPFAYKNSIGLYGSPLIDRYLGNAPSQKTIKEFKSQANQL